MTQAAITGSKVFSVAGGGGLAYSGARVYATATQNFGTGTGQVTSFDTFNETGDAWDIGGYCDNTNKQFVAPATGKYRIGWWLEYIISYTTDQYGYVDAKLGGTWAAHENGDKGWARVNPGAIASPNAPIYTASRNAQYWLNSGDTVFVQITGNYTGGVTVQGAVFEIERMA